MNDAQTLSDSPAPESDAPVRAIVDDLADQTGGGKLALRDIIATVGQKSLSAVLLVPALLVFSPLSGIPLFSSICGMTIVFVSAQMLVGRRHLWLPDLLMRQEVDGARAEQAIGHLNRLADWLDRHSRPRLQVLVGVPGRSWVQLLCLLSGLVMPLLEVVPFSSSAMGLAVTMLATGLLTRDGLFALIGMVAILGTAAIVIFAVGAF